MKAKLAWVIGRTLGLAVLASFGVMHDPARAAAHCQGCKTTCVPNGTGGQTCSSECITVFQGGANCTPNPDGKGCTFGGFCAS